jgi:hypothetical protein
MELIELKDMWQQYDKKLSENTRLNKEILKKMILSKSENRLTRFKLKAGFNLILPIVIISLMLVPNVEFRNEIEFYIGFLMFGVFSVVTYYWSARYFWLIGKIDFTNPITLIKKNVNELEKYKIKMTKLGYIFSPFAMIGVFLIAKIPIFSKHSLLPFSLIILVMLVSIYFTFKYSIFEQFKKINEELNEIEQLEQ